MEWESEGFWHRLSQSELSAVRRWVRWRLVGDPRMSDVDVDRLLAHLPASVFEEVHRRALRWESPVGLGLHLARAFHRVVS